MLTLRQNKDKEDTNMVSEATKRRLAKCNRIYRNRIPNGMMNFVTVRREIWRAR